VVSTTQRNTHCSASCLTQDHDSYGECLRAKNLRVAYCQDWKGHDATRQKRWDKNLADYRTAREQGIDPKSTWPSDVQTAVEISEKTGEAFRA